VKIGAPYCENGILQSGSPENGMRLLRKWKIQNEHRLVAKMAFRKSYRPVAKMEIWKTASSKLGAPCCENGILGLNGNPTVSLYPIAKASGKPCEPSSIPPWYDGRPMTRRAS